MEPTKLVVVLLVILTIALLHKYQLDSISAITLSNSLSNLHNDDDAALFPSSPLPPGWLKSHISLLSREMKSHRFGFVVGHHFSGTTLLKELFNQHPDVSSHENTGTPENEGQHMQSVYPPAYKLGGIFGYANRPESYRNENSSLITDHNRLRLYGEWRCYWNVTKPILVEKSPPHVLTTRFLQAMFSEERSFFVIVLRHPVSALNHEWGPLTDIDDCGEYYIVYWLQIAEALIEDIPHLKTKLVLHLEHFLNLDSQVILDAIFEFLGMRVDQVRIVKSKTPPGSRRHEGPQNNRRECMFGNASGVPVSVLVPDEAESTQAVDFKTLQRNRRHFFGDRKNVFVYNNSHFDWVNSYETLMRLQPKICHEMQLKYEERVNRFGYSLIQPRKRIRSPDLEPYYVPSWIAKMGYE